MKCLIHSVKEWKEAKNVLKKYPYFEICDYIKQDRIKEYSWRIPVELRLFYTQLYIEGDENFIFKKLKEISNAIKNDQIFLTFRDDGNIEAMIYDDFIERKVEEKMIDIKTEVKKFADSLKAEGFNYRILVFTDKDVIDLRDLSLTQLSAVVTRDVWELSKKTGKTVEEVLHGIAFTIKVFEEEFEEEKK